MEPVGVYIHIPFCVKKCNYCDFPSFPGLEDAFHEYAGAVCKEMERFSAEYGNPAVDSVFIGGGTPSLLSADDIAGIITTLRRVMNTTADAEITLEANPGTITREKARACKDTGMTRISLGLQAAQDHLLQSMGRIHTREMFLKSIEFITAVGIGNINADIMFGLPGQSMDDWLETMELVIGNDMNHISAYSLQIEKDTPWFELQKKGELPNVDEDLEREMYHRAVQRLGDIGYCHYEISNFAKPGFESRHNLKYWTGKPYLGFGASAHSFFHDERVANVAEPLEYIGKIRENQSPRFFREAIGQSEKLSERFFLGLRLIKGISLKSMENEFGREAINNYSDTIKQLENRKLLIKEGDLLRLTKNGLDFANQVWMEFL
ncbi:MAG: radical SAM family heme chaperone HemW [Thermoclostridium sp.]|nr:radical SAM family heme chaperone HemW [Thermoclostridium sp.]